MKILISIAVAAVVLGAASAHATGRMSDTEFMRASQCLAYVNAEQIPGVDTEALRQELVGQRLHREQFIRERTREDARAIARQARQLSDEASRAEFSQHRAQACTGLETMIAQYPSRG